MRVKRFFLPLCSLSLLLNSSTFTAAAEIQREVADHPRHLLSLSKEQIQGFVDGEWKNFEGYSEKDSYNLVKSSFVSSLGRVTGELQDKHIKYNIGLAKVVAERGMHILDSTHLLADINVAESFLLAAINQTQLIGGKYHRYLKFYQGKLLLERLSAIRLNQTLSTFDEADSDHAIRKLAFNAFERAYDYGSGSKVSLIYMAKLLSEYGYRPFSMQDEVSALRMAKTYMDAFFDSTYKPQRKRMLEEAKDESADKVTPGFKVDNARGYSYWEVGHQLQSTIEKKLSTLQPVAAFLVEVQPTQPLDLMEDLVPLPPRVEGRVHAINVSPVEEIDIKDAIEEDCSEGELTPKPKRIRGPMSDQLTPEQEDGVKRLYFSPSRPTYKEIAEILQISPYQVGHAVVSKGWGNRRAKPITQTVRGQLLEFYNRHRLLTNQQIRTLFGKEVGRKITKSQLDRVLRIKRLQFDGQ